jgi:DNA adenine methylase
VRVLNEKTTPFLKWAGGKRWLAPRLQDLVPKSYNRYFEPFLGSGATFFALNPEFATLSDTNAELINCYCSIRDDPSQIISLLKTHKSRHSRDYYYQMRRVELSEKIERAARFIYLNRTCWNGLYRVNLNGIFNVPIGTKDSVVLDTDDFSKISCLLKSIVIECCDFEHSIDKAVDGDFVFVDPPYTARHNHNGFIKYNEHLFSWADQIGNYPVDVPEYEM